MTANLDISVSCFDFNFKMPISGVMMIVFNIMRPSSCMVRPALNAMKVRSRKMTSATLLSPPSTTTVWSTATATFDTQKQEETA